MTRPTLLDDIREIKASWHDPDFRRGFIRAFLKGFLACAMIGFSVGFALSRIVP